MKKRTLPQKTRPTPVRSVRSTPSAARRLTVEERQDAIRALPESDRTELLAGLQINGNQDVIVKIFDGQQADWSQALDTGASSGEKSTTSLMFRPCESDKTRPRVVIVFGDRSDRPEIDIMASLRSDASNLAHPAILFAIRFWQRSVICRRKLSGMGPGEGKRLAECARIAEQHLRNVGKALAQGAIESAWPAEYAFDFYRTTAFNSYSYLEMVFEEFCESGIPNAGRLVKLVENRLGRDEIIGDAIRTALPSDAIKGLHAGFEMVAKFLESEVGRFAFKRRQLKYWKNLYDKWRFPRNQDIQRRYRGSAVSEKYRDLRNQGFEGVSPDRNWETVSLSPDTLNLPVVLVERT